MLHEQGVERYPEPARDDLSKARFRLLGGTRADHAEAIGDAMDVGVHGDRRNPVTENEDTVGRLRPYRGQRYELLEGLRNRPRETVEDFGRARAQRPSLGAIEPRTVDERLDLACGGSSERLRIGVAREEAGAGRVGRLVAGPLREDGADEDLERALRVVSKVGLPPIPGMVEGGEAVEHALPVDLRPLRHGALPRAGRWDGVGGSSATGRGPKPGSDRSGSSLPPCSARRSSPMR